MKNPMLWSFRSSSVEKRANNNKINRNVNLWQFFETITVALVYIHVVKSNDKNIHTLASFTAQFVTRTLIRSNNLSERRITHRLSNATTENGNEHKFLSTYYNIVGTGVRKGVNVEKNVHRPLAPCVTKFHPARHNCTVTTPSESLSRRVAPRRTRERKKKRRNLQGKKERNNECVCVSARGEKKGKTRTFHVDPDSIDTALHTLRSTISECPFFFFLFILLELSAAVFSTQPTRRGDIYIYIYIYIYAQRGGEKRREKRWKQGIEKREREGGWGGAAGKFGCTRAAGRR